MDMTLIQVLIVLARKWDLRYRQRERRDPTCRERCEALELRIEHESSPIPKLQLLQEQVGVDAAWAELWDSESYFNEALETAVRWCAAHTGFGSRLIFELAVAGFDASALKPELQAEAQKLSPALLGLPATTWQTTEWAKLVLSEQPKSGTSGHDGNADGGASSTPAPKGAEAPVDDDLREAQDCEKAAYYAFRYAEMKQQRKLTTQEAHDFWKEHGFDPADRDTDNADVLKGYEITSLPTFRSQLSRARKVFDDLRYEDRTGRRGRSVVDRGDLE